MRALRGPGGVGGGLLRLAFAVWSAVLVGLAVASPAAAHGGVTGTTDLVQHYGVLVFLLAVVLIGAGVLIWVMLSPPSSLDLNDAAAEAEAAQPEAEPTADAVRR